LTSHPAKPRSGASTTASSPAFPRLRKLLNVNSAGETLVDRSVPGFPAHRTKLTSIWQRCQISPLFYEDGQDGQLIIWTSCPSYEPRTLCNLLAAFTLICGEIAVQRAMQKIVTVSGGITIPFGLACRYPNRTVISPSAPSSGGVMGLRPTAGDESCFHSFSPAFPNRGVIPTGAKRSGGICSSADLSWKCFFDKRSDPDGPALSTNIAESPRR
jgi:hypothetical protein